MKEGRRFLQNKKNLPHKYLWGRFFMCVHLDNKFHLVYIVKVDDSSIDAAGDRSVQGMTGQGCPTAVSGIMDPRSWICNRYRP